MIETIFCITLMIAIFYTVPLVYCMKKAYEEGCGFLSLISLIPLFNLFFSLALGFEDLFRYLKRRKHD